MDLKRPKKNGKPSEARLRPASRGFVASEFAAPTLLPGVLGAAGLGMAAIEKTISGLGYDLVEIERLPRGLMRISIDRNPGHVYTTGESDCITVDDCELVTRQLQYVLEVEQVDYARLEVSSPGLDRPLRKLTDWQRFCGQMIDLTLKLPFEGRKKYQGTLFQTESAWRVVFLDGKVEKALDFGLDEVREARLVAQIDFKGRRLQGDASRAGAACDIPMSASSHLKGDKPVTMTGEQKQ
jgi:ribosome maturation factor RimP